jgi:hypothetical protein
MSVTKRTRQHTKWIQPGEISNPPASFQNKILGDRHAEVAFQKITRAGVKAELIWKMLWELPHREVESNWYSVPGLPLRYLTRFPKRVRGWAKDIENVSRKMQLSNAYGRTISSLPTFLDLQVGNRLPSVVPKTLARRILEARADLPELIELPELLRLYADHLEAVCKFTAYHASKARAQFRSNPEFALIEHVKKVTGKPHFLQIARLLTAAYYALGSPEIVDDHSLSERYYRRRSPLEP